MTHDSTTPATTVAGRYELERRLAVGGMATVHLGRDRVLDRFVAIKVLHSQLAADPAFVARFRREAQAAGRLGHPNIVAVYDWGSHDDTYYMAMEYIRGETLAEGLAEDGPMSTGRALQVAIDVVSALGAAHDQGTIHRDIKPSNIIIGPSGDAKVTDFGIARAREVQAGHDLTEVGSVIGTASYLSPEQAQGLPVDPRSDLYSVGVVLFEMVTGRRPFVGSSPMAVLQQHIEEPPPAIAGLQPAVPAELDDLIARLLAKDPADRLSTAVEVEGRLKAIRSGHRSGAVGADGRQSRPMPSAAVQPEELAFASNGDVPPTAIMPPQARPDAGEVATPWEPEPSEGGGRSGWPVILGAFAVVGLVVLLLVLSQTIGDGSSDAPDTTDVTPVQTSAQDTSPSTEPDAGTVAVPDVRGRSQSEAEDAIRDVGLTPRVETVEVAAGDDRVGRVISQSPEPGRESEGGAAVTISVGVAAQATPTTQATTTTAAPTTAAPTTAAPTTAAPTTEGTEPPTTPPAATSSTTGG